MITARRLLSTLGGLAALALLPACAGEPAAPATTDVFADALAEAGANGAGSAQLADLERAASARDVTVDMAREAARRTVDCLVDAGLDAQYSESTLADGLVLPDYVVALASGEESLTSDRKIEDCVTRESLWVNKVYQLQPTTIERRRSFAEEQAPTVRACLEENGIRTAADADGTELVDQAFQVSRDTSGAVDCVAELGLETW
jgi:hypothetical protein